MICTFRLDFTAIIIPTFKQEVFLRILALPQKASYVVVSHCYQTLYVTINIHRSVVAVVLTLIGVMM